jgi:hypothetical protein
MPGKSKDATNTAELKKFEFKKDKMQTNPYGIEDRKIKIEKLMSQKEKDRVMKDFTPYRADPTAGKTAPPKYSKGGRVNLRGGGCAKRGVKKNAYGKNS